MQLDWVHIVFGRSNPIGNFTVIIMIYLDFGVGKRDERVMPRANFPFSALLEHRVLDIYVRAVEMCIVSTGHNFRFVHFL